MIKLIKKFLKQTPQPNTKIKVMIVDDHRIFRNGVRNALANKPDIEIIGEAENGRDMLDQLEKLKPEIVIMGIMMPVMDGFAAMPLLRKKFPYIKVIILSMNNAPDIIARMMELGANTYLTKQAGAIEIYDTILACHNQWLVINEHVKNGISSAGVLNGKVITDENGVKHHLSEREIEFIKHLTPEITNRELADKLDLSPRTVEAVIQKLKDKIGIKSKERLIMFAEKYLTND